VRIQITAHAIREPGGTAEPFLYEQSLGNHDVLIRITHCSIARGDVQFMDNDWGDTLNNSRRTIYGNYIGSRADSTRMLAFSAAHGIEAIVEVMPMARVNEAIARVRTRAVPMGLVLENPEHAP
jgi:D-arabinose 1-dehydrogenase-like Zn-dependent alcohol dehydrogenase